MLLLGVEESGKSTLVKQLKILHENGFSPAESLQFKAVIRASTLELMKLFLESCFDKDMVGIEWRQKWEKLQALDGEEKTKMKLAVDVWSEPAVSEVFAQVGDGDIDANAAYFLSSLERICGEDYSPTEEDILSVRTPTKGERIVTVFRNYFLQTSFSGIVETTFQISRLSLSLIDVGGQRTERKHWLHCFSTVNAVLFVAALTEFDSALPNHSVSTRMDESLTLFGSVCNAKWFEHASMVLFLNKKDLLEEKLQSQPDAVQDKYPDFKGRGYEDSVEFLATLYLSRNVKDRDVYRHVTCAKDGGNIKVVFQAVTDMLHRQVIKGLGLY